MQMYGHSDLRDDAYVNDSVEKKARELGRNTKCFYFSTKNSPNIKIFKSNLRMKVPNPRRNGNDFIGYSEEIKFGYGYFTNYGGDSDGINADFSSISNPTLRKDKLDYIIYKVYLQSASFRNGKGNGEGNRAINVGSASNKCFTHIIPPEDGIFPTQPLEELSEEERAKLLGPEPASPSPPLGSTYNNPPPLNLSAAAKRVYEEASPLAPNGTVWNETSESFKVIPSSHKRYKRSRTTRKRSTRRRR